VTADCDAADASDPPEVVGTGGHRALDGVAPSLQHGEGLFGSEILSCEVGIDRYLAFDEHLALDELAEHRVRRFRSSAQHRQTAGEVAGGDFVFDDDGQELLVPDGDRRKIESSDGTARGGPDDQLRGALDGVHLHQRSVEECAKDRGPVAFDHRCRDDPASSSDPSGDTNGPIPVRDAVDAHDAAYPADGFLPEDGSGLADR
jgi:hypothetical protein